MSNFQAFSKIAKAQYKKQVKIANGERKKLQKQQVSIEVVILKVVSVKNFRFCFINQTENLNFVSGEREKSQRRRREKRTKLEGSKSYRIC